MLALLVLGVLSQQSAAQETSVDPWQLENVDSVTESAIRALPGVAAAETRVSIDQPRHIIVHIKDWHYLALESFAADLRASADNDITETEMQRLYQQHLREVKLVQDEQTKLLRRLIRRHGLRQVYLEGLAEEDLIIFDAKLRVLRRMQDELPQWEQELQSAIARRDELAENERENSTELSEFISKLDAILTSHRHEMLRIGAVGRLMIAGELKTVVPLEEFQSYQNANPLTQGGSLQFNRAAMEKREDAQVQRLMQDDVSVVVLGGAHDLSNNLRRLAPGSCRYMTVATRSYARFSED